MSNLTFLYPNVLWVAPVLLLLFLWATRWLMGMAAWRRRTALVVQSMSAIALVAAVAQPVLLKPDKGLSVVLVVDASSSISQADRATADSYAKSVVSDPRAGGNVRVVVVGREASLLKPEDLGKGKGYNVDGTATDLAAGLRLAGSLLGDSGQRRAILLSDGWETQGSAETEGAALRSQGVDLQVVALSALGKAEVLASRLDTTPYVRVGDTIYSDLQVFSTQETTATLSISVDGGDPETRQVNLKQGENSLPIEQKANNPGFHRVSVTVQGASDTRPENNTAGNTLVVKDRPKVLILEDRNGESTTLSQALLSQNIDVDIQPANSVPTRASDLGDYDAVVLDNVAATSLTLDQQRTLQEYVRRYGRGLVATGGQTSFAKGGYPDSVIEDVLPVSSHPAPRPEKGATALILVMDRSASMDDHIDFEGRFTKFSLAKDAARLAVDALRPGDMIGVLAFDTENMWAVPVQTIRSDSDKDAIKNRIASIPVGNGTSIYPAVQEAADAIQQVTAPSRHLVLLTDGLDNSNERYEPIMNGLQSHGITLSTIGIGSDADKDLLISLAKLGQGRYYFTEQPQNIPKIMFRELDLALKQAVVEGSVQPHLLAESPVLRGFKPQDLPTLGGYDITTSKPDAVLALVSDKGDPLLAHWNYGLGRVLAFTSEAGPGWADLWLSWGDFAKFWDGAVRWTMSSPVNRLLEPSVSVDQAGAAPGQSMAHLSVESLNPDNTFADLANITAALRSPDGVITTTVMSQTAPGHYEANVPVDGTGAYEVMVSREGDNAASESAGFTVQPGEELMHAGTNDRLLRKLSGGNPYQIDPKAALDLKGMREAQPERQPLWEYALAPGLLLLLLSVIVRRVDFRRGQRRVSARP